jgi:hypothetical protein
MVFGPQGNSVFSIVNNYVLLVLDMEVVSNTHLLVIFWSKKKHTLVKKYLNRIIHNSFFDGTSF